MNPVMVFSYSTCFVNTISRYDHMFLLYAKYVVLTAYMSWRSLKVHLYQSTQASLFLQGSQLAVSYWAAGLPSLTDT